MIFLGCLFDKNKENEYLNNSRVGLSNASNTFQWNLLEGLYANSKEVKVVNVLPVGTYPFRYKKLFLKGGEWRYSQYINYEIGCINLPFIKQFQRYLSAKKQLLALDDKDLIIYSAYAPFLKATYKLDKSYRITAIITDLPEFYDLGKTSFIKKWFRKRNNKKIYKYLSRIDNFVLLTEHMKDPLRVGERPYIVIEGIANLTIPVRNVEIVDKSILYSGTLHRRYGILNLLKAFSMIEDPDAQLWICGDGDSAPDVVAAANKDMRIKYFGFITKEQVAELQQKADILINPRPNEGEYTKYSFPSKTMEYMISEKPVIMYKLDGIPSEYDRYIYYITGDSPEGIKNAIIDVLSRDPFEKAEYTKSAARFVINNKNSKVQAKKILDFLAER